MRYLCPHHDIWLVCSRCDGRAATSDRLEAACQAIDRRQLWGLTGFPHFEAPCPVCGKGLTCVSCLAAAIEAAMMKEE